MRPYYRSLLVLLAGTGPLFVACFSEPTGSSDGSGPDETTTSATTSGETTDDGSATSTGGTATTDTTSSASVADSSTGDTADDCAAACPTRHCNALGQCARIVFATSSLHDGNLGGLVGADEICRELAKLEGLPGGDVEGGYRAWLSASDGVAPMRVVLGDPTPFALVDGTPVAMIGGMLLDAPAGTGVALMAAIDHDERGVLVPDGDNATVCNGFPAPMMWTGTLANGTVSPTTRCDDWTSSSGAAGNVVGRADMIDGTWTNTVCDPQCAELGRLYCFQMPPP